jgi:nitrate reductase NapD
LNLSGILVVAKPGELPKVIEGLGGLQGVEVHQVDEATGRIVVVQEAEAIRDETAGLREIKSLPGVMMAEMVYHYIGEDQEVFNEIPPELAEETPGEACAVPAYLND